MSAPAWWDDVPAVPSGQPRSLAEVAEEVFRAQDLLTRQEAEADKQRQRSQALRTAAIQDEAEVRAWLGRPAPSAIEHYLAVSEMQDRQEEHDRKRRERLRAEAAERRVAELEAELAAAEADRTRSVRTLGQANQGWAAARDEAESFRDAARYRSYGR